MTPNEIIVLLLAPIPNCFTLPDASKTAVGFAKITSIIDKI